MKKLMWFFFVFHAAVKQKVEQKLEQMGKVQGVCLHTAHVLCMDAVLNVGLEMGSHNQDCWPHVFRYSPAFPKETGFIPCFLKVTD